MARRLSTGFGFHAVKLSFLFTTNKEIQKIHKRFMGLGNTTDVITFADKHHIDIAISLDQAFQQAKQRSLSLFHETVLLMCHSLLHAKGYNDLNEKDRLLMRQKEFEWLAKIL